MWTDVTQCERGQCSAVFCHIGDNKANVCWINCFTVSNEDLSIVLIKIVSESSAEDSQWMSPCSLREDEDIPKHLLGKFGKITEAC